MSVSQQYLPDVQEILSHRHDGGADFWTTPDKRLIKGAPFSALESASYLLELGMDPGDPPLREVAELILDAPLPDRPRRRHALPAGLCRRSAPAHNLSSPAGHSAARRRLALQQV